MASGLDAVGARAAIAGTTGGVNGPSMTAFSPDARARPPRTLNGRAAGFSAVVASVWRCAA